MPSGVVLHYQPCKLVCYLTLGHASWCGALLSSISSVVLPHYRACLLVWCLIINHACWCGSSIRTMPVGVVLHYEPCLPVNCHCNQHFTSRVQMEEEWLQVWCNLYRGAIISDMSDNPMPLSDMPSSTMQLLSDMHAGFMNSSTHVCKVLLYQAMYLVCYKSIRHSYG